METDDDLQKSHLLESEAVVQYFGQVNSKSQKEDQPDLGEEDDFS